jgi:hypothetical protein
MTLVSFCVKEKNTTVPCDNFFNFFFISIPLIPYSYGVEVFHFSLDLYTIGRTPGRVIGPSQGLYLNTGQHKHRKTRRHTKHPCPKWDSNPRSQRQSERRQFMATVSLLNKPKIVK